MTFRKLDLFPPSGEGRKTPTLLGTSERAKLNPVSETLFSRYLEFQTIDKSRNPVILSVIHHRQNPLDSTNFYLGVSAFDAG
jgi:hypothetical protein